MNCSKMTLRLCVLVLLLQAHIQNTESGIHTPFNLMGLLEKAQGVTYKGDEETGSRQPRNPASIVTLLWPQVVGPMEHGVIEELNYKQVPKTWLEYHLDVYKEKVKLDVENRHRMRMLQQSYVNMWS